MAQDRPAIRGGYRIIPGAADSPTILHVPHSSVAIPRDVREGIVLTDDELARELALMTDAHTDLIAEHARSTGASKPWLFVNQLSRLVVDPERFPDDREGMRAVGMGAIYTRTSDGRVLRAASDPFTERQLLDDWYVPYANAVTDLVDARLAAAGRVTIIDVHSYPSRRLAYEIGGDERPAVCLGTHAVHTPPWLLAAARETFSACGDNGLNTPFEGCYIPLKHFETDPRVTALMVEIRRDIYMTEPGGPPTDGLAVVSRCLATLIDRVRQATPPDP